MPDIDYKALAEEARGSQAAQQPSGQTGPIDYQALANEARGASDDDLIRQYGGDPAIITKSAGYQQNLKRHGSGISFMLTKPGDSIVGDIMANATDPRAKLGAAVTGGVSDVGHGAFDVVAGLAQLARHGAGALGLMSDADVQYADLLDRVREKDYVQNVRGGNVHPALRLLGNILTPIPGGPEVKAGETLPWMLAKGAARGAVAAAVQPVETPGNFAAQKGLQAGTGAAIGAAIPALVGGATKAYNALRGNIPAESAELIAAGKRAGVRLLPGDITQNPIQQKAEILLEEIPVVGTSAERAAQQTEAKGAAQALQGKYYEKFLDTDSEDFKDVVAAAAKGDQRARNLVDKLQNAGADPDKNLQASIGLADFRTRQTAEVLYDKVESLAQQHQLGDVPLDSTVQAIDRSLEELKASKIRQPELIGLLQEIRGNITPKKVPLPANPLLLPSGEPLVQPPAPPAIDNSYQAIRQLRSDLGDRIRSYYQGANAIIGEKGVGHLERTQNAIEDDLRRYAQQSGVPEIQAAGQQADQYYRTARVPFKDGMLAQAAVSTEPDQIYQQFIKGGKGDRAQKFYQALDDKGRAAVKYSMIADAANKATDPARDIFSPQNFFRSLSKIDDAYGVFFRGPDKFEVDGFQNLMRHVTRAGQYAEKPPTGARTIPLIMAGLAGTAAHFNPVATAASGTLLALAKPLMMSDTGKKFLLAAATLRPGSPAMQKLYEQALNVLPQLGAKAATAPPARRPLSDFHLPSPGEQPTQQQ